MAQWRKLKGPRTIVFDVRAHSCVAALKWFNYSDLYQSSCLLCEIHMWMRINISTICFLITNRIFHHASYHLPVSFRQPDIYQPSSRHSDKRSSVRVFWAENLFEQPTFSQIFSYTCIMDLIHTGHVNTFSATIITIQYLLLFTLSLNRTVPQIIFITDFFLRLSSWNITHNGLPTLPYVCFLVFFFYL